jgi:glutamyl-tRNA synthetase
MIRTRLAPSPTGFLHVGTLRTALYCYLLAKKHQGQFFLRIEDTDQSRSVPGAVENILNTLEWAGITPDEGVQKIAGQAAEQGEYKPYTQSKRLSIYQDQVKLLLQSGHAYHCFCTPERLARMREEQIKNKKAPMYDRKCLQLSPEEIEKAKTNGEPYVIRQKIPRERTIILKDLIRGKVKFDCATLDDQVLLKSDGFPTYHLAHVVDDHLMQTNPVIRGEEWLPSTPKHLLLFEAFGWESPPYAHLPLLLNPDRSKLSKRQGDVAVEDYIKKGYLPEAVINFVAFLGWNPGVEQELFTMEELIERFSLARVHKGGAVFDLEKLNWFNGQYIRKKTGSEIVKLIKPYLVEAGFMVENYSDLYLEQAVKLTYERFKYLAEVPGLMHYYFRDPEDYHPELILSEKMKVDLDIAKLALIESLRVLEAISDFSEENLQEVLIALVKDLGLKNGQVLWPIRVALTGESFSPGVFEVAAVLGQQTTVRRIKIALEKLETEI